MPDNETLHPNGDGVYTGLKMSPDSPATHYDKVLTSGDSKYVYNDVAHDYKDTYTFAKPTVRDYAISQLDVHMRKAASNYSVWYKIIFRTNDTEYTGPQTTFVASGFEWKSVEFPTNPVTGDAWTLDELDVLEAGLHIYDSGMPSGGYIDVFELVVHWGAVSPRLPSWDLSRVTGIRHIYRPGSYRLEATLGDVSTSIELPQRDIRIPSVVPTKEIKPEKPEKVAPLKVPEKTVPELLEALREEGASADITAPELLPTRPGILEQFKPISREDLEKLGIITGREAPSEPSLWQRLTPWKEERGETFGTAFTSTFRRGFGEVAKLGEFYKKFFGGLFG